VQEAVRQYAPQKCGEHGPHLLTRDHHVVPAPQHDSYSKDSYGKKSEGKKSYGYGKSGSESNEKKSSFYDPPKFYTGRYGLGHFGEEKKASSSNKGGDQKGYGHIQANAEIAQAEVEKVYDGTGYDRYNSKFQTQQQLCAVQYLQGQLSACRFHCANDCVAAYAFDQHHS
jgi:hypothetical protein